MRLREKLILGSTVQLALLLLTGVVGVVLLRYYSGTVDRVFRENYNSVVYGQSMKDAVDELQDESAGGPARQGVASAEVASRAARLFEDNLRLEEGNITVPGEAQAAADLRELWRSYRALLPPALAAGAGQRAAADAQRQAEAAAAVKRAAQRVITLNLENILDADGQIRRSAVMADRAMYTLLGADAIAAIGLAFLFIRSILRPLRVVTHSAREIERGNLDLVVRVPAHDEIGQLAEAFNSMAMRLREKQRSDRLKIVRAQRSTQLAIDSLPDAVAVVGEDGSVEIANSSAQRLFRLRPGIALRDSGSPQLLEVFATVIASRKALHPKGFDAVIQVFDPEERFFLPHALPILDSGGEPAGVTMVLADITELRRLDEMKSNLLAVVSHELKTPLTGLRMATHLLLDERTGALNDKQADLALAARDECARLNTIIEGLLHISRLPVREHALMEAVPMEPRVIVDRAVDALAKLDSRDKGVSLDRQLPATLPPGARRSGARRPRHRQPPAQRPGNPPWAAEAGRCPSARARTSRRRRLPRGGSPGCASPPNTAPESSSASTACRGRRRLAPVSAWPSPRRSRSPTADASGSRTVPARAAPPVFGFRLRAQRLPPQPTTAPPMRE